MDNNNQQSMDDFLRELFPDYQGVNSFPAETLDLPDAPSLDNAWLCGIEGSANLPASGVAVTPQNGDGQLQSDYPSSLPQVNENADLHTPPWFIIESSIIEQRIDELHKLFTELQESIRKIMTYQKHLLPWTVAMNDSQSTLAEQVVEISRTLSHIAKVEAGPKAETAANDNSQGVRSYGMSGVAQFTGQ